MTAPSCQCSCDLVWYRVTHKTIAHDRGKITLTLNVGVESMKDPQMEIVMKSTGADWGLLSINEVETQWLLSIIFSRDNQALEFKGEGGVSERILSVKYWNLGRPFVKLVGMLANNSPTEVDIPYECIKPFAEYLAELVRRFRNMILSLSSTLPLEKAQVEGVIDSFNEEEDGYEIEHIIPEVELVEPVGEEPEKMVSE